MSGAIAAGQAPYVMLDWKEFTMEIEHPETLAGYDSDAVVNLVQNPSTWVEKGRQPVPVGKIRVNPHGWWSPPLEPTRFSGRS